MTIFVGSTNPVKINAVKQATVHQWPDAQIVGLSVPSGINEQPMSDEETRKGARNRATAVLKAGLAQQNIQGDVLGVGLEGGVMQLTDGWYSTVWVSVTDQTGEYFDSNGARFRIPNSIVEAIEAGTEMGDVLSQLFNGANVRHLNGFIGVVTRNFVTRTDEYAAIARLAIGLWYGQDWEKDIPNTL